MITVCIATYNGQKFIKEQISSILCQLDSDDEIIISDDSSTDETINIIEQFNDSRIQILRKQTFHSPIFNFENAIKHSKGEYIFLSDQDDVWSPFKVSMMLEKFKEGHLMVFSNANIINSNGDIIKDVFFKSNPHLGIVRNMLFNNFLGATLAFKKELLSLALPFPSRIPMHDQWLGVLAKYYGTICYIDSPLISYRRHDANASFCSEKSRNSFLKKISFRYNMIIAFFMRITSNIFRKLQ